MNMSLNTTISMLVAVLLSTQLISQEKFSLGEAISYALDHHPAIVDARLDGADANAQYKEVFASGIPSLNGNINYSYFYRLPTAPVTDFISPSVYGVLIQEQVTTESGTLSPADIPEPGSFDVTFQQPHSLSLGLSTEFFLFDGNYLKGLKAARLFISLAEQQVELTEQEIVQNVARSYQAVLIALKNVDILDNNIQNISSSLAEAQEVYKNGFIEQLDVDRLQLSLENLELEQQKLTELIEVSYTLLKYQMAYDMSMPIEVTEDLETVVNLMSLEPTLPDTIDVNARPEHRLLSMAIDLEYADLDRIKQANLPTLRAFANYGQNLNRNKLFDGSETGFLPNGALGLSARIPIYDGGSTKARVQQKKILIEQREIELSEFDRAMKLQVLTAQRQLSNAQKSLQGAERSLKLNEKIYSTTQIKYREGVGSSVEVSQAEASLYQAQAIYINALYDLLTSKTELDIATGQILKTANSN